MFRDRDIRRCMLSWDGMEMIRIVVSPSTSVSMSFVETVYFRLGRRAQLRDDFFELGYVACVQNMSVCYVDSNHSYRGFPED